MTEVASEHAVQLMVSAHCSLPLTWKWIGNYILLPDRKNCFTYSPARNNLCLLVVYVLRYKIKVYAVHLMIHCHCRPWPFLTTLYKTGVLSKVTYRRVAIPEDLDGRLICCQSASTPLLNARATSTLGIGWGLYQDKRQTRTPGSPKECNRRPLSALPHQAKLR